MDGALPESPGSRDGSMVFGLPADALASQMAALWRERALTDVQLHGSDGRVVHAHKLVLAASCAYFRALLLGAGTAMREAAEAGPATVRLQHTGAQLAAVVEALYTRRLEVDASSLQWLLELGSYLEAGGVVAACSQYMRKCLSLATCVDVLLLASQYHLPGVKADAMTFTASRLPSLLLSEHRAHLARLPADLLAELLASEALSVDSELDVLSAVTDWVAADVASRSHQLPRLMTLVQLSALPPEPALPSCLSVSPEGRHMMDLIRSSRAGGDAAAMAAAAAEARLAGAGVAGGSGRLAPASPGALLPIGGAHGAAAAGVSSKLDAAAMRDQGAAASPSGRVGWTGGLAAPRRRSYRPSRLMIAGGHDTDWHSLKSAELYDPATDTWSAAANMQHGTSFAGAALVGRDVYVVGGTMFTSVVERWDASQGEWRGCASLTTPRIHSAVAAAAGRLFVVGGSSQINQVLASAEVFTPPAAGGGGGGGAAAGRWQGLADMHSPRSALAAASLAGRIYAVGGQAGRRIFRSAECYDPEAQQWLQLGGGMATERKYAAAAALGGRIYVLGGMNEQRQRLGDVEAYDPRDGAWRRVGQMKVARSSCGAAALQERLYVVGGAAGDRRFHDTVEVFEPAMQRWAGVAPTSFARCGMAAAAL